MRSTITLSIRGYLLAVTILLSFARLAPAQTLQEKLAQKADFIPQSVVLRDALIELAIHYQIPMGIEWTYDRREFQRILLGAQPRVEDMIDLILSQRPGYFKQISAGVLNVRQASIAYDKRNFLSLRLREYDVRNVNVFGAEAQLRLSIRQTRHPENYSMGVNGGYGQPNRGDGFNIKNISYRSENVDVREVLNAIVRKNGNSLWIVELNPQTMMNNEPFFAQRSYDADVKSEFIWRIIALRTLQR